MAGAEPGSADRSPEATRDRACGALLGLAVADALWLARGRGRAGGHTPAIGMAGDEAGGEPLPRQWGAPTAMAIALASSLIGQGPFQGHDLLAELAAWYTEGAHSCTGRCDGIDPVTRAAIVGSTRGGGSQAGPAGADLAGCASLVRLAPVAIRYWQDRETLRDTACEQSRVTHDAPETLEVCERFALMLADAIGGQSGHAMRQRRAGSGSPGSDRIAAGASRGKSEKEFRPAGTAADVLEAALWCVEQTGSFAQAVLLALDLGEDAGSAAVLTGQLAGALHGGAAIPAAWRRTLAWVALIESLALELTTPWGWYPD